MRLAEPTSALPRLHRAARVEDVAHALVERLLRRRGWRPWVLPYAGYGTDGWVRVLGRVLLVPPGSTRRDIEGGRGWRRFLAATATGEPVTVQIGDHRASVTTGRGGYLDAVVAAELPPGWAQARLSAAGSATSAAPLRIVGPRTRIGLVSDIDDTVMITALPRPLVAFWNTFVRREAARRPVPGMAELYRAVIDEEAEAFVVYLSTGAWNVAPALESFLRRHGFPRGPLLMTDWGPTAEAWFRSGQEHKRSQLARLIDELPQLRWLLVGDDGQHDPELYCEAAATAPSRVQVVAIRELTPAQQVLTHGTPEPPSGRSSAAGLPDSSVQEVRAPDGHGLLTALRARGVLSGTVH